MSQQRFKQFVINILAEDATYIVNRWIDLLGYDIDIICLDVQFVPETKVPTQIITMIYTEQEMP